MTAAPDPVMIRLRTALDEAYGARIERVILFGSRARGDARPDSDYDMAVFLKDFGAFADELTALVDIETDLLRDTGAVINALPLGAGTYGDWTGFTAEGGPRRAGSMRPEAEDHLGRARVELDDARKALSSISGVTSSSDRHRIEDQRSAREDQP